MNDYGKYARVERERKFLLRDLPEPLTRMSEHVQMWDSYITGTRLRLRRVRWPQTKKQVWKLTQKFAPDAEDLSRTVITNIYLSEYEYEVLSVFEGNEIRKNRYPFEYEGRAYSIDLFIGPLWGLVLAETDFENDEELDSFKLPPFAVEDVTNDQLFTGARLSGLIFADLKKEYGRRKDSKSLEQS